MMEELSINSIEFINLLLSILFKIKPKWIEKHDFFKKYDNNFWDVNELFIEKFNELLIFVNLSSDDLLIYKFCSSLKVNK